MKLLMLIDLQKDFAEGGALAVNGATALIPKINKLIKEGRFDKIVATKDWHPKQHKSFTEAGGLWPPHCVSDTDGATFIAGLDTSKINETFTKGTDIGIEAYSAIKDEKNNVNKRLANLLKEADVTIVGIATDYCVRQHALDAKEYAASVTVILDCCAGVGSTDNAINDMKAAGVIVR
jgi:nicotinamidase/pyrazinamidase